MKRWSDGDEDDDADDNNNADDDAYDDDDDDDAAIGMPQFLAVSGPSTRARVLT